jgi:hypothetical protein
MDAETTSPSTTTATSLVEHPLLGKWDLYYHLPQNKNWDLASYKVIMGDIDTAEKLVSIGEALTDNVMKFCMLFAMRKGVSPMWEDPKNKKGGCFSYKINNKNVSSVWKNLSYSLVGESLTEDVNVRPCINGITISPKKNFCIVKIWLANCNYQNPAVIADNLGISSMGCLFKTHIS